MHFYQTRICATGARHSKIVEQRSQRTVCLRAAEYYPGYALVQDLQGDHRVKVVNQNGSVQLGEKAAEYYL